MLLTWLLIISPIVIGVAAFGLTYLKREFYRDTFTITNRKTNPVSDQARPMVSDGRCFSDPPFLLYES